MATLLEVGPYIINLDTVTTIELDARPVNDAPVEGERLIRIHFTAPAIHLSADDTPPTPVTAQTLEVMGADADLLRRYLAYETDHVAHALDGA